MMMTSDGYQSTQICSISFVVFICVPKPQLFWLDIFIMKYTEMILHCIHDNTISSLIIDSVPGDGRKVTYALTVHDDSGAIAVLILLSSSR